jgi:DNA primase
MPDILTLIDGDTTLKHVASTNGGEYAGSCPWCAGTDRFRVWPEDGEQGRYWCRMCGRSGDAITYVRERRGLSFQEACEVVGAVEKLDTSTRRGSAPRSSMPGDALPPAPPTPITLTPPGETWQSQGRQFIQECEAALWSDDGGTALDWLRGRGLTDDTIRAAQLGFNGDDKYQSPETWGRPADAKRIWLPRGIVIPWLVDGGLWRVNIRRPLPKGSDDVKYIGPAGSSNALYGAEALSITKPAVLLEGEIDALSVQQCAGVLITAVATGSTGGARRTRWIAALALSPLVLVMFDSDKPGDEAAKYWCDMLPDAHRWRPDWGDVNAMLQDGADIRALVSSGIEHYGASDVRSDDLRPGAVDIGGAIPSTTPTKQDAESEAASSDIEHWPEGDALLDELATLDPRPAPDEQPTTDADRRAVLAWRASEPAMEAAWQSRDTEALHGAIHQYLRWSEVDSRNDHEPQGACIKCSGTTWAERLHDGTWICIGCGVEWR